MALELLVLTVDDALFQRDDLHEERLGGAPRECASGTDDLHSGAAASADASSYDRLRHNARSAKGDLARSHFDSLLRAYENAFVAACAERQLDIREQALAVMDGAERNGVRLALASTLSSRMVCALMESAIGRDWADQFAVVATADALSAQDTEAELYHLILRTAAVPAHRALLVTATERSLETAQGIGIHSICLSARGDALTPAPGAAITHRDDIGMAWAGCDALEMLAEITQASRTAPGPFRASNATATAVG